MSRDDILRYAFLSLVALVLLFFGMKWWSKQRTEKEIVNQLRSLTSTSSSFEQFNADDTRKTLLRTLYHLQRAKDKLDIAPDDTLDIVFKIQKNDGFMSSPDPMRHDLRDPGEQLVRDSLLRNYEKINRLGIFDDAVGREALKSGEAPQIPSGDFAGRWLEVSFIIDPEVSPGIEKIVPNLVVGPPTKTKGEESPPTAFDIARAKGLAATLHNANKLERDALTRILAHYDELSQPRNPPQDDPPAVVPADTPAPSEAAE